MTRLRALLIASAALGGSLAAAPPAHATLGGDVPSITANTQALGATRTVKKLAASERHELVLPSGVVVRQYVSPAGAVYAITWRGAHKPNLRELLGAYFAQLSSGASKGGHHRRVLTGSDLVVESFGHAHLSSGRAWVPSLVPAGVKIDAALE